MGVDIHLILANSDELSRACRGWREALPRPVVLEMQNPFTHAVEQVTSWDPSPFASFPDDTASTPDLSGLVTVFHEGLHPTHIERLGSLLDAGHFVLVPALIPPPGANTIEAHALSRALLERLAEAGADAAATADAWSSAALAEREWCARVLTDLVDLASKALAEGRRVYAFIEES